MSSYLCKYCGHKAASVAQLTAGACQRHPDGPGRGKHALYEGSEHGRYVCKHCGHKDSSLSILTAGVCQRHPNGPGKGRHAAAL